MCNKYDFREFNKDYFNTVLFPYYGNIYTGDYIGTMDYSTYVFYITIGKIPYKSIYCNDTKNVYCNIRKIINTHFK